jgi:hypothetical protein
MNRKHAVTFGAAGLSIFLSAPLAFAQLAVPGNKNILIVCGNENNTVINCTSIDDITLKNRLEILMGHRVTMIPHNAEDAEMLAAANAADLVIIPESVSSGQVGTALVSTPTPIISSESFLQDEFGLIVPPYVPPDPGYPGGPTASQLADAIEMLTDMGIQVIDQPPMPALPANATPEQIAAAEDAAEDAYDAAVDAAIEAAIAAAPKPTHGVTVGQLAIVITNPDHPLAAGFSGLVHVYRFPREMNWGVALAPGAEVVATLAPSIEAAGDADPRISSDYSGAATIYFVPKGGQLADGSAAAGLRIQYFVENENGPGTYNLMTEEGFRLFDAAIEWALMADAGM